MRANILPTALFAALTLTVITSVRADEATFEVTWLGDSDKSWTDSGVWNSATPAAWQTAIINDSSLIKFKAGNGETVVSNIVVGANASPTFQRAISATTGQRLLVQEMNGEGTLRLNQVGIHANYQNYDTCNISVAKIEAVANGNNDSWFDGGSASGKRMVVNSDITVNGFLKVYKQTTLAGETTLAGKLLMVDEAVVVNNLVYAGDDATIDSASKGTVGRLTVRSGTLSYSALPTGVTLGSLVLDGGTLSVTSDFSGTIAVAEGGGTLFLEGEWNDDASVSLPAGLSFAEGADLSKVTVQATIGESTNPAIFAIVNDNEAYSLEYIGYPFHLEELDLSWMTSGWEHPVKNKSIFSISDGSYTSLQVWNGTEWQTYSRGISVQTESHWFINLGGEGKSFSATVGLDKSADGDGRNGSKQVKFAVLDVVGGTTLAETGWMGINTAAATLTADLTGVEIIDLVAYKDEEGGDSWQHVDWCEPVIVMAGDTAPAVNAGMNRWTGKGADTKWSTAANWQFGVPRADATAVFDSDAEVYLNGDKSVSNLVVNAGVSATLKTTNLYGTYPSVVVQEINGEGTLRLWQAGIKGMFDYYSTVNVNVAEIESTFVWRTNWGHEGDNWINGPKADGQSIIVNSKVTGDGYFRIRDNVTVKGEVRVTGQLDLGSDTEGAETTNAKIEKYVFTGTMPKIINETLAVPDMFAIRSGIYDCASNASATWQVALDGGTVDVGTGATIKLAVVSGGYIRMTASETPTTLPEGVTFAADADLSNVFAIVTVDDVQSVYSITESAGVYSLSLMTPDHNVKWIGGGANNNWTTPKNWLYGAVPTADDTAIFEKSATVVLNKDENPVGKLTIAGGCVVQFKADEWWADGRKILFGEIDGDGTVRLDHVGLVANCADNAFADIKVSSIEIAKSYRYYDVGGGNWVAGDENYSWLESVGTKTVRVYSDICGSGYWKCYRRMVFAGDNSGATGKVEILGVGAASESARYFDTPKSFFPNASSFSLNGRIYINFTSGTARLGNVAIGESWGAALIMKHGAEVVLEVSGGSFRDSYFGNGYEVRMRTEDEGDYVAYSEDDAALAIPSGCAGLTIRKVGDGTLVYGVTKPHNLVVAGGHVEFTGENNNGDDADVSVTVKNGASIGSAAAMTSGNGTAIGGDVTVRHQFTFEPGAAIKQEYIATTTTDEQTQDETTTYSMRKLTIADDVDLANVVFGVTNPEDLPAVTKAAVAGLPRFTMFAANSLSGVVATENDGYAPDGSEKNCKWLFRTKRNSVNEVEFYPFQKPGFAVIVR